MKVSKLQKIINEELEVLLYEEVPTTADIEKAVPSAEGRFGSTRPMKRAEAAGAMTRTADAPHALMRTLQHQEQGVETPDAMMREISPEEQATQKAADTARATTWAKGPKGQAFGKVSDTLVKKANIEYPNRNNTARISDMLTRAMAGSSLHKPWDPTTGVEGISDPRMQKRLKRWTTPKGMTRTARKKARTAPETVTPQQRKTAGMPATRRGAQMQERLQKIIQEEITKLLQEGWWDRYKRPYRDIANTIYDLVAPPDVPVSGYVPHEQEIDQNKVKELMKHGAQPWEHAEKLEDAAEQANAAAAATALLTLGLAARSGQAPAKPTSTHTPITFSGRPGPGQQTLVEPVPSSWLQRLLGLDESLYKTIQEERTKMLSEQSQEKSTQVIVPAPRDKYGRRRQALGYTPPLREPKTKYDKEYHKYMALGMHPSRAGLKSSTEERIIIDDETGTAGVESGWSDIATPGTPSADPHWLKGRPPIESWGQSRHATADEIARGHGVDYGEREKRKWAFHGEQANYDPDWQGAGEMMSYPEASGEIGQTNVPKPVSWWEKGKSHEVT